MAVATVCVFIFAVKKDYFRDIEDTKFQVFWSDLEELVDSPPKVGRALACQAGRGTPSASACPTNTGRALACQPGRGAPSGPSCPTKEHPHARGSEKSRS